jgi:hypothetical protein
MVGSAKDLFVHPDAFFAQVSKEKASIVWPLIIVASSGIVSFAGAVFLSPAAIDPVTQYSVMLLSLLAVALATWIVISTGLFLLSKAFAGTGSYLVTLQNTGYGMLPFVFSSAVTLISVAVITGNMASLSSVPNIVFSAVIYVEQLVFTLWAVYLLVCGIRNAHGLPTPLAIASVVIVVAISFAIFVILSTMPLH